MKTLMTRLLSRVGVTAIVGSGLLLSGCFGTGSNEGGFFSECYLNHADDNVPFLESFNGKLAAGGVATLSLGACTEEAELVEVRFDEGAAMSAEIVDGNIQITAQEAGEARLYVTRRGEDEISFDLEAVTATKVRLDPESFGMVVGTQYESAIQLYDGDEFLAGGMNLPESAIGGEGVSIEQISPTRVKLDALTTGEYTRDLGLSPVNVKVVEVSQVKLDAQAVAGSDEASALVLCQFQDENDAIVVSVPSVQMPTVSTNDESICRATAADNQNGDSLNLLGVCASVERTGAGDCELTISFGEIESTLTVDFTVPTNENP